MNTVGDEILGDGLTAVLHQGFMGVPREKFEYETRPESMVCVHPSEGTSYYAGGFQGGTSMQYIDAMRTMRRWISLDEAYGIIPRWHDESAWARLTIDTPPSVILGPKYMTDEGNPVEDARIYALRKDHAAIRAPA